MPVICLICVLLMLKIWHHDEPVRLELSFPPFLSPAEFGLREDLRKMEVAGVSSKELYVKRELVKSLSLLT